MNPELEDSKKLHDYQVINDPAYAAAWEWKKQELNEAWDKAKSHDERVREAGSIVQQQHLTEHPGAMMLNEQQRRPGAERIVENCRRNYINYNAAEFQQDYKRDPERVLNEIAEKRQAREQAQNKNKTLDLNTPEGRDAYRVQVNKNRFRDVGNAVTRPNHSASEGHTADQEQSLARKEKQTSVGTPDLNTPEGRDAYRTQIMKDRFRDVGNAMTRPDLSTHDGRNAYRAQMKGQEKAQSQGQEQTTGQVKIRNDDGHSR